MSLSSSRSFRSFVFTSFALGTAIAIATAGAVRAEHVWPDAAKTFKCSTGTACVSGSSTGSSTFGVYGLGTSADGVHGVTDGTTVDQSGVAGLALATTGDAHGVYGQAAAGDGVHGVTTSSTGNSGVAGIAEGSSGNAYGVFGLSDNGYGTTGVAQNSSGYAGVYATGSGANFGLLATGNDTSGEYPVLFAEGTNSSTYIANLTNSSNGKGCVIDPTADLTSAGKITGDGDLTMRQKSSTGRDVLAYASESATPTIEDLGAAQMHGGTAFVQLPADLSSVISHNDAYYVFLTPMGDTRGLYVSTQNSIGFQVRENERGRSNVAFEYRIVAVPSDARNIRFPTAPRIPIFASARIIRR